MERKFEIGDLVTLTNSDYRDIKKGTLGIVMKPINKHRCLMNVWIDGQKWSFPEHEFVHTRDYKEERCR